MKLPLLLAPLLLIAACGEQADTPVVESEAAEPEVASIAGMTFEIEGEDGVGSTYFGPDGTYTDFLDGEEVARGTYEQREDGLLCFTPDAPDEGTDCWTLEGEPDTDGWMTSRRLADGLEIRVRPVTTG
ncbi:hypothetical protein [Sphingomicrobium aestuariivivum]|uniref:hypothetical protein n=1 Tax=Sphingomicrobium aestuariivivum TaxID=1582356 RepID=UPI001FD6F105|nr:hypothetical protein [Sphingomicrobium aestuariivivum]MCJ8190372.1 hypothetical protein [Sphingomicrobium aestuariivivum]